MSRRAFQSERMWGPYLLKLIPRPQLVADGGGIADAGLGYSILAGAQALEEVELGMSPQRAGALRLQVRDIIPAACGMLLLPTAPLPLV